MPRVRCRLVEQAACIGRDPEWWSGDRLMGRAAVEVCLECPVREPCLREALAVGDSGVIRGGMLLLRTNRGRQTVPLVCGQCHDAPVMTTPSRYARFCSPACASAAARVRAASTRELVEAPTGV